MRFKKVYVEITNGCNLKCDFCIGNKRKVKYLSFEDFKIILYKIRPYTKYLYFHILGEPLLHPNINEFIEYAYGMGFYINITTNGYLIDRIKNVNKIRQLNVSLHSYDDKYGISLNKYLDGIFDVIDSFDDTYVSLRIWVNNKYNIDIIEYIENKYSIKIDVNNYNNITVSKKIFLSKFHEFVWPDLDNNYYNEVGKCYGLIDHIGILSDGSIVPCCLDTCADICLGNIYNDNIEDVISSERVINMITSFRNNHKCEELCRHCGFLDK